MIREVTIGGITGKIKCQVNAWPEDRTKCPICDGRIIESETELKCESCHSSWKKP